jgi:hypothetical protein
MPYRCLNRVRRWRRATRRFQLRRRTATSATTAERRLVGVPHLVYAVDVGPINSKILNGPALVKGLVAMRRIACLFCLFKHEIAIDS